MKSIKALSIGILLSNMLAAQDNPYAIFGHETKVTYETTTKDLFRVNNQDTTNAIKVLAFNYEQGYVLFLGENETRLDSVLLKPEQILRFISTDPAENEYPSLSPYAFVANNPINAIDPDGQRILFVNGFTYGGIQSGQGYWRNGFISGAQTFFNDKLGNQFIDGQGAWNSSGAGRYQAGYAYAQTHIKTLTADLVEGETFKIVTHSHGGAYGAGVAQYLIEQGYSVETVVHLSTHDPQTFTTPSEPTTYQLGYKNDIVVDRMATGWGNISNSVEGTDKFGLVDKYGDMSYWDQINRAHADTRFGDVWEDVTNLRSAETLIFPGYSTSGMSGIDNTAITLPPMTTYLNTGTTNFSKILGGSTKTLSTSPQKSTSKPKFQ